MFLILCKLLVRPVLLPVVLVVLDLRSLRLRALVIAGHFVVIEVVVVVVRVALSPLLVPLRIGSSQPDLMLVVDVLLAVLLILRVELDVAI